MGEVASGGPRVVRLVPEPLTPAGFAEFGTIVGQEKVILTSTDFPFFASIVTLEPSDHPIVYLNRHLDHHQLFLTLDGKPMIVVVASPRLSAADLRAEAIRAFVTDGNTAIVFHVGTWHLAPRAVGRSPVRALNVQATNPHVHTERVDLGPTFGYTVVLDTPRTSVVLQRIRDARARLEALITGLDEQRLAAPGPDGWSVKDHLIHIAVWNESLLALLEGRDRDAAIGVDPSLVAAAGEKYDRVNAEIHRLHQHRSAAEVLAAFRDAHARVLAAIEKLDDADLLRPYSHYQPTARPADARPVIDWIAGNTWEHDTEHALWISKLLALAG